MENLPIELPPQVTETVEAAPALPEPETGGGNLGTVGIVLVVIAAAAVCAKLYKCNAKK